MSNPFHQPQEPGAETRRDSGFGGHKSFPVQTTAMALALVVWTSVCACAAAGPPETAATSADASAGNDGEVVVTLRIGESMTPPGTKAVVTVIDVSDDSRCPVDATCVWAGDATVTLRVQPAAGAAESVSLHIGLADSRSATVAGLHLRLEGLEPARRSDQPIERDQYRVALAVRRHPPQELR